MEGQYTTRELEHYFTDFKSDLTEIKQQVTKTNGRVNNLENWRWLLTGGMVIITLMVIPLVIYIYNNSNMKSVEEGLRNALSAYEIEAQ